MLRKCSACSLEVVPKVDGSCPSCGTAIEQADGEGAGEVDSERPVPEEGIAELVERYHTPSPPRSGCATTAVVAGWVLVVVAGWRLVVRTMMAAKFGAGPLDPWTSFVIPIGALIFGLWLTRIDFSAEEYRGGDEHGEDG